MAWYSTKIEASKSEVILAYKRRARARGGSVLGAVLALWGGPRQRGAAVHHKRTSAVAEVFAGRIMETVGRSRPLRSGDGDVANPEMDPWVCGLYMG